MLFHRAVNSVKRGGLLLRENRLGIILALFGLPPLIYYGNPAVALLVGGAIAIKPLAGLLTQLFNLASVVSDSVNFSSVGLSAGSLPQYSTVVFGGLLALAFVVVTRLLEE